jgi:hypothetical protein
MIDELICSMLAETSFACALCSSAPEAKVPYLQRGIQTMPLYESLKVFKAANDKEKATLRPALRKKIVNARKTYSREEWKAVKPLLDGLSSQIYY